jgi:hypothetical protein
VNANSSTLHSHYKLAVLGVAMNILKTFSRNLPATLAVGVIIVQTGKCQLFSSTL